MVYKSVGEVAMVIYDHLGYQYIGPTEWLSYEDLGTAALVKGDCLEVLAGVPDDSIDMILTDPPYGMSFVSNFRGDKYDKIANDNTLEWLEPFVAELFRVAKDDTAHYMFCSYHHIDKFKQAIEKYFKLKNILVWEKNNTSMGDLRGDFAPKVEFVLFFHKGRRLIEGKRDPNIFKFARTGNNFHPTEKPVDMLRYLMTKFSSPGDLILDPFMGSGSTGVAAVEEGRRFLGVELVEEYFTTADRRVLESIRTSYCT
jgi:site-specific DNA-methyltransferase (adenine-specific)